MTRPKPFLTYFILAAIPLLLLAALNYWHSINTVSSTISSIVQSDLNSLNVNVDELIADQERAFLSLASTPDVRQILAETNVAEDRRLNSVPDLSTHFRSVTLFDRDRQALLIRIGSSRPAKAPEPDERVWHLQGSVLLDKPGSTPGTIEYTAPVHAENGMNNIGALVGALDLRSMFATASQGLVSNNAATVVVLDRTGNLVYHSDRAITSWPLPSPYIAAYSPIPRLNVSVAVARSPAQFSSSAHRWGIVYLSLALLAALVAAFVLERHVQRRSRGMERVTEDLSAIAKGELDRRIILQSSDDARGIADNINVVTERLRAQIAREEESRQFESFIRLSAMLTHDLKNAIEGLSLTVGNMERHFDNPQFRSDAMKGLTGATDKLKAIVARLARPVMSLSGEHKRPTKVDLVPIIQRVVSMTAEPQRGKHKIVTRLPQSLFAFVDAGRVEEVIENLVLNALEAMDTGGTLTIEAGENESGAPAFSISDTGRGMSRIFIENRLFRPFSTTKKTGIGLGLYTCREVIRASSGTIEVDSVEGAGTTFRVVLPSIPNDRRN